MGNVIIPFGVSSGGTSNRNLTADPFSVLDGYTFVGAEKRLESGAIPSKSAEIYIPGQSALTIPQGRYLSGDQTIKGDPNLIASNIRRGVTLFGIQGTYDPPLRLGVTAADHSFVTNIWLDPGDDIYEYQADGIRFRPRRESTDEGYVDIPQFNASIAFSPQIDFSQYTKVTVTGYLDNNRPCFQTLYNDYIGPEISYDFWSWRFITHNQSAGADGYSASFDISSENTTGFLTLVFQFKDLNSSTVYVWPGRSFVLTSVTLT